MFKLFKRNKRNEISDIELVHVYTFKSGEKLYTYKPEDISNINYRYHRNIKETMKYLELFSLTKETWNVTVDKINELILDAVGKKDVKSKDKALLEISSTFTWFKDKLEGVKTQDEALLELYFCTFFLLEDEKAGGYSEKFNTKKKELLSTDLVARDFFLTNLQETLKHSQSFLTKNTLQTLKELKRISSRLTSLNTSEI